jgi:hypothetical protein
MAVDAPAMGKPPAMDIFVVAAGFGVELREVGVDLALDLDGPSPIRYPVEACCLGGGFATGLGSGLGVVDREALLLLGALGR